MAFRKLPARNGFRFCPYLGSRAPCKSAVFGAMLLLSSLCVAAVQKNVTRPDQPNVLFILADDMRPSLPSYGHPEVHAPTLTALAARGLQFNKAYCAIAVCAPSRNSLLVSAHSPDPQILASHALHLLETGPPEWQATGRHTLLEFHRRVSRDARFSWC